PRLPAKPARAPIEVDVLDVGEEALIEWPGGPLTHLGQHRHPIKGGGGRDAEHLLRTLPLAAVRQVLAAVACPPVAKEDVASAVHDGCGATGGTKQLACDGADPRILVACRNEPG